MIQGRVATTRCCGAAARGRSRGPTTHTIPPRRSAESAHGGSGRAHRRGQHRSDLPAVAGNRPAESSARGVWGGGDGNARPARRGGWGGVGARGLLVGELGVHLPERGLVAGRNQIAGFHLVKGDGRRCIRGGLAAL